MSRNEQFAKRRLMPGNVLITGASGGIGAAVARQCARPGVTLFLWGRNIERLQQTARTCELRGAVAHVRVLDLANAQQALTALREDDDLAPLDACIMAAGVPDIRPPDALTELPETVLHIAEVNFTTPVTLATEAARRMAERGAGRIVAIGSVAAFHDLPFATAYSGSKAGLLRFMTALHAAMKPHNVGVTIVSPGYIDTAMSRRLDGARPFLMSPEAAASRLLQAMRRRDAHVVFPKPFIIARLLEMVIPRPLVHAILRRARVKQRPLQS